VEGKENQDACFTWQSPDGSTVVMGVFDGHGRDFGRVSAATARAHFLGALTTPAALRALREDPGPPLVAAFREAHDAVEAALTAACVQGGWRVDRTPEGYLVRSRPPPASPGVGLCVHGGTTATVLIVLDGKRVLCANVGDSGAMAVGGALRGGASCGASGGGGDAGAGAGAEAAGGGARSAAPRLMPLSLWTPLPQPLTFDTPASSTFQQGGPPPAVGGPLGVGGAFREGAPPPADAPGFLELSAEHSPESEGEYWRMASARPAPGSVPRVPLARFQYDTLAPSPRATSLPIFAPTSGGALAKRAVGGYYKNVRSEWASLVATPTTAAFHDALAFTRSLGDFHLQCYGVTWEPDVAWVDVAALGGGGGVWEEGGACEAAAAAESAPLPPAAPFVLLVASDGVWDNWTFEDAARFTMEPARVRDARQRATAADLVADTMRENKRRAAANFGESADNMTLIACVCLPPSAE
jgi:serine/threonine protein phosphatase PrpC